MQTSIKNALREWENEVAQSLTEGFRQLFTSSSEVLLEFADAAENNQLQRMFFDAQREFYLKEETIIGEFERNLRDQLLLITGSSGAAAGLGADTLSLVEVEDYERSLALETIAKRTIDRQLGELHGLAQRLSALLGGRPLPIDQVPGNPMQIMRVFDLASRKLDVEKEVRLVFYTLFDRYVMSRLGALYTSLNQRLVGMGILPNIKFEYQRFGRGEGPSGRAAEGAGQAGDEASGPGAAQEASAAGMPSVHPTAPTSAETLSAISSLLAEQRRHEEITAEPLSTSVPISATAANIDEAIADERVLGEAPNPLPIPSGPPGAKVVAIDAVLLKRVQMALQKQRKIIKNLVGKDKLDRREEDIIDIVGMLFEAMLNEKLLANSVKTLLSHLHTRYLKIAVQSRDFLENSAHPARRLFERMLDAGIKWVREDKLRAGIYPQLQEIVTRILGHKTLEDAFFEAQIAELDSAEKKLEQQSTAAEDRTLEAERGRARLEQAKAIVKQTVDEISADIEVSPAVISFLSTTYADYLTLLLLRSNLDTESNAWSNAYSVGEALIAAAVYAAGGQPLGQEMREDLSRRLEGSVGSLIPHHEHNIRRVIEALDAEPEKAVSVTGAAPATAEQPTPPPRAVEPAAPAAQEALPERPVGAEDQKVADKLMREAGNWFVMQNTDGTGEQAVKLLWVNPHTRNMLFVDQHGAKVALIPAISVAQKIREGAIRPKQPEASSFVARSLRRIRRALEDSVNA
jgi:hypothetical protein